MKCKKCDSDRIATIYGKTSDSFQLSYKGIDYNGYPPTELEISEDQDSISFRYCLDCGTIQGNFPVNEEIIQSIIE